MVASAQKNAVEVSSERTSMPGCTVQIFRSVMTKTFSLRKQIRLLILTGLFRNSDAKFKLFE